MNERSEELWDIYTKDRQRTGKTHRRGDKMKQGEYHLVIHVCIFNEKNQLLIQQRQPFKKGWSNLWDLSAAGSALAGETSSEAAEREVWEELGLKLDFTKLRPYFSINFPEGFDDYYIVEQNIELSDLHLQQEEVKQVRWAEKEEVLNMREQGVMVPYHFLDRLFEIKGNYNAYCSFSPNITVQFASRNHLESWMNLIEIVSWNFPGLETEEKIENYRNTVIKNIERKSAICATNGKIVVGILLFSTKYNMLSCMAVHPAYRRKKIATQMIQLMLTKLDRKKDIVVETFCQEDEKGVAPRALYQSLGFVPKELSLFENEYPVQKFILKGEETGSK